MKKSWYCSKTQFVHQSKTDTIKNALSSEEIPFFSLDGNRISTRSDFFKECSRILPNGDSMGLGQSGEAFVENMVDGFISLANEPNVYAAILWDDAQCLLEKDIAVFFEVSNYLESIRGILNRGGVYPMQLIILIMGTGDNFSDDDLEIELRQRTDLEIKDTLHFVRLCEQQSVYDCWDPLLYRMSAGESIWLEILRSHERLSMVVAYNKTLPPSIYDYLSKSKSDHMREWIASNHRTPGSVLEYLSKDSNERVVFVVSENPNTPLHVLELMATIDNDVISLSAQGEIYRRSLIQN